MPESDQDIALIPNEPILRIAKPRRLYGREAAEASLMASFDRISHGQGEVVLVPGHSGVGKTALVREIRRPVRKRNGFFLQGKFNQYQQNIPYFAIRQALAELARELRSEDKTLRQQWVSKLQQAVGVLGQLLVDLAPEFDALLGPQPPVAEIGALEARHRFAGVIRNLFDAVCGPEHPVVLFIDDWQWADTASFELLKELQIGNTLRYLLVIAPYRDNEVDHAHPLVAIVEELRHQTVPINIIEVKNLEAKDVRVWLKEMLQPKIDHPDALAEFIHSKTGGNPFFTQASLEFLYDFGLLQFDHLIDCWRWKMATEEGFELSDNVEELFRLRLCRLEPRSQNLLAQAACLGNRFDLDSLAVISKSPADACKSILLNIPEMIAPISHGHSSNDAASQWFMFVHDRVQQAAYGTISAKDLPSVRLKIGKLLLSRLSPEHLAERLFEVADHLNMGQLLIEDSNEQVRAVELNIAAARKARAATAYRAALQFHRAAGRFLENPRFADHLWNHHHPLALSLFQEWAESEFLEGNQTEAENYIQQAVTHGRTAIEKAEALNILIVQNTLKARYPEAIAAGRQALAALGIILPEDGYEAARQAEIDQVRRGLKGRTVASLLALPIMSHPEMRVAAKILITMGPPCYRSHQRLWGVIVPKVVNLTLHYGNIPQVGYSHPAFAGLLCWVADDFDLAKEFGKLATRLMTDVFHSPSDRSVYALMIGSSVRHWFEPLKRGSEDYQEACEIGLQSGNLQYTAYAFGHNMYCRFYQGLALNDLIHESQRSLAFSRTRLNQWAIDLLEGGLRVFSSLACNESDPLPETEYLQGVERHHNIQVNCIYKILKTFHHLVLGRYHEALELSDQVEPILYTVGMQGLLPWPEHVIARLLILTALAQDANEKRVEIEQLLAKLRLWADQCPENFEPLYLLAQAELARLELKTTEAVELYEQAIAKTQSSGCIQWEGLSNEKAARFWQMHGNGRLALMYWQQAYRCFEVWGSKAKLQAIEAEYIQWLSADLPQPEDPSDWVAKQAHDALLEKQIQLLRSQAIRAAESRKWSELEKQAEELAIATENLRSEVAKRKSVEEELRLHREQLEDRVKERTAELEKSLMERKQAEEALLVSEKRLKFSIESGEIGIWELDLVGHTAWRSLRHDRIFGYETLLPEWTYETFLEHVIPEDRSEVNRKFGGAIAQSIGWDFECRIQRKDGEIRWIWAKGNPELNVRHEQVCMFGVVQDITERKRHEEELRRYKDHLEEEVQQRTADLVLARNAAEAANQAKSVFLANMSHELRTPLNAILGFSGMMRKDPLLLGSQRQNLDIINRSGEHLLTLINDVLEMAKIEAGRVQIENAPLDLGGMVRDITDMMQLRAEEKGLHMLIDQSSRFPRYIIGDEARLRQILINLTGNAIKFTQQGGVTLRLGTRKNKTEHLLIEVEDSGPGIAAEDQKRIFQPFVQLGGQKESKGTGLGLSITHQFVQLMGGEISLQSTLGSGSLFRIDLPLIETMKADIATPKDREKGEIVGLAPGQPEYRILIVEDQLENQLLLTKLLESAGFQVKVAEDGKQGVQMFQNWHPHFIWMDRRMPVMDGLEATRMIRKLPGGKDVKIVAVTASAFIEQRSESLEAGMDDFVRKPYRFNEIYECLSKQLGVRYRYQGIPTQEQPIMALTPDMLAVLPDDLRNELENALENLENKRIEQAIRQIAPIDLPLQKTLTFLAENFDYPAILKALREYRLRTP